MRLQEYLEEAVQDILEARTYITTNSIPVVRYDNFNTDREGLCVVVRCATVSRVAPNYDKYECVLETSSISYKQSDIVGVSQDALVADIQDELYQDMTTTTLQTAVNTIDALSGITIDGLVNLTTDDVDADDFTVRTITTNIYLTYVP